MFATVLNAILFIFSCLFLIQMDSKIRRHFLLFSYVILVLMMRIFRISADMNLSTLLLCIAVNVILWH